MKTVCNKLSSDISFSEISSPEIPSPFAFTCKVYSQSLHLHTVFKKPHLFVKENIHYQACKNIRIKLEVW